MAALAPPIHIRLPEPLREALRAEAEATGTTEAELARQALSALLEAPICKHCAGTGRRLPAKP